MSEAELVKRVLAEIEGHSVGGRELLELAKNWPAGERAVREAVWTLLERQTVELTPDRKLRMKSGVAA
jgi:hypothetical protein